MKRTLAGLAVLTGLLAPACIRQETTHTLYLTPDGSVTWMTIERDIRSDSRKPADRIREEQDFLARLAAGAHPTAAALRQIGGESVRTRVLRNERPWAVMTEARFARVEDVFIRWLGGMRIPCTAWVTRDGSHMTLDVSFSPQDAGELPDDDPIEALYADWPFRIVLTEGRFVSAVGFTLDSDEAIATFDEKTADSAGETGPVRLSLTWALDSPRH